MVNVAQTGDVVGQGEFFQKIPIKVAMAYIAFVVTPAT
jgi:hypothetical protein